MAKPPVQEGAVSQPDSLPPEILCRGFYLGDWWVQPEDGRITRADDCSHLSPLQIHLLLFLARFPGQVVTKEKLFEEVWKGAAVEDGVLPRCISELRGTLGDNAQQPTYIETVPRRGYRLLASVNLSEEVPEAAAPITYGKTITSFGVGLLLLCVLLLLPDQRYAVDTNAAPVSSDLTPALVLSLGPTLTDSAKQGTTAVLGFKNLSGKLEHAWLSTALSEMLASELALSPELRSIPGDTIARVQRELSMSGAEEETRHRIQAVLGAKRIVFGSYLAIAGKDEEKIRIDLWVEDADSGTMVANIVESGLSSDLFELVALVGMRLREKLGVGSSLSEGAHSLRRDLPRQPSPARLYFEGLHELHRFRANRARDLLEQSIAEEPDRPLSHLTLAE